MIKFFINDLNLEVFFCFWGEVGLRNPYHPSCKIPNGGPNTLVDTTDIRGMK